MPTFQDNDHSQQSHPASTSSVPNVPSYQHTRRESEAIANTPVTTYPPYQASSFATSQLPQYASYTSAYAQPPSFTSPYQPPPAHGLPPATSQAQAPNHTQTPYAAMTSSQQQQHYGSHAPSSDAHSQQDHQGDNHDSGGGGVTVQQAPY